MQPQLGCRLETFIYLRADELPPNHVSVRLAKAKNGQVKRTRDASEYRDPWRMFGDNRTLL